MVRRRDLISLLLRCLIWVLGGSLVASDSLAQYESPIDLKNQYEAAIEKFDNDPMAVITKIKNLKATAKSLGLHDLEYEFASGLAMTYIKLTEFDKAFKLAEKYLETYPKSIHDRSTQLFHIARLSYFDELYDQKNSAETRIILERAVDHTETANEKAFLHQNLAISYTEWREYGPAFDHLRKAQVIFEKSKTVGGLEAIYNEMAILCDNSGDFKLAIEYYNKALTLSRENDRRFDSSFYLYNIGKSYKRTEDYQLAIDYFEQALVISRDFNDRLGIAWSLRHIAEAKRMLKHPIGEIEARIDEALKILRDNEDLWVAYDTTAERVLIHLAAGSTSKARSLYSEIESYAADHQRPDVKLKHYQVLYSILEAEGNYQQALQQYRNYIKVKQDLSERDQRDRSRQLKYEFDAEQKTAEIALLQKNSEFKDLQLQSQIIQTRIFVGITLATLLFFLVFVFLWRRQVKLGKIVTAQAAKIRSVVRNVQSGIIIINSDLTIDSNYSPFTQELLGEVGLDHQYLPDIFTKLCDQDADKIQITTTGLANLFNIDDFTFQLNKTLLADSLYLDRVDQPRTINLGWTPLFDDKGLVRQILITLADVSNQTNSALTNTADQKLLLALKASQRFGIAFIKDFLDSFSKILEQLCQSLEKRTPALIRDIHTAKGNLRMLGFSAMAALVHDLEDLPQDSSSFQTSRLKLETLRASCEHFRSMLVSLEALGLQHSLVATADQLRKRVSAIIDRLNEEYPSVGASLEFSCDQVELSQDVVIILVSCAGHLINNSYAHGFLPVVSQHTKFVIHFTVQATADAARVTFSDSGCGLDPQALPTYDQTSPDSIMAFITQDGYSSKQKANTLAGRGVGLAAVKAMVDGCGGTLRMTTQTIKGSGRIALTFHLSIPLRESNKRSA